jgi:hypothetical protein
MPRKKKDADAKKDEVLIEKLEEKKEDTKVKKPKIIRPETEEKTSSKKKKVLQVNISGNIHANLDELVLINTDGKSCIVKVSDGIIVDSRNGSNGHSLEEVLEAPLDQTGIRITEVDEPSKD